VRKTSRELGVSTDSSYRFERRVDPAGVLAASARAVDLILQTAGGSAEPEVLVAGQLPSAGAQVALDHSRCRALLGLDIADTEIDTILQRLGLVKSGVQWTVPSFRPDLTREVDLIEEVIRVAGIERAPSRLRGFPAAAGVADLRHDNAEKLRERLRAQGFSEARTSHFVSPEALQRTGIDGTGAVAIRNPLGADQALLRPVLLSGLLEALARNLRHGADSVRLFELGPVFGQGEAGQQTALERTQRAVTRIRSTFNQPAPTGVVVQHLIQRRHAAVVHIRGCDRDVAQCWGPKPPHVFRFAGDLKYTAVAGRISAGAAQVVQPRVLEQCGTKGRIGMHHGF
jgi:phenylalanyl-tRNA synthetase beta chain